MRKRLLLFVLLATYFNVPLFSASKIGAIAQRKKEQLQRIWHCVIAPKKYDCSSEELSRSKKWLSGISAIGITTLLTLAGIAGVSVAGVKRVKKKNLRSSFSQRMQGKLSYQDLLQIRQEELEELQANIDRLEAAIPLEVKSEGQRKEMEHLVRRYNNRKIVLEQQIVELNSLMQEGLIP